MAGKASAAGLTRKVKRKLERQEKKQRKNKKSRVQEELPRVKESASHRRATASGSNGPGKTRSRQQAPGTFQNKFHELVQETTGRSIRSDSDDLTAEDVEIKALEGKLGISNKKDGLKRLQKEYTKDGLGEDFADFLSSLDSISKIVKERKKVKPTAMAKSATIPQPYAPDTESEDEEGSQHGSDSEHDSMDDLPSDMEMDEETRQEFELLQQEDAEFLKGMDELPTDESDLDSDADLAQFESEDSAVDLSDDEEVRANTLRNARGAEKTSSDHDDENEHSEPESENAVEYEDEEGESDGSDVGDREGGEDEVDSENEATHEENDETSTAVIIEEDIYGRPVIKSGDGSKTPSAYIPPHLRRQMQEQASVGASDREAKAKLMSSTMDEQALRELTRRINGQLNRISESNMESISLEMEKIYREHGRSIVNAILLDKILQTSCHPRQVMTPLIKVCGALIAALYHSVGSEIGGFFIEKFVLKLVEGVENANEAASKSDAEEDNDPAASKEAINLLLLVAMLYNFGVVQCTLIYDLFRRFVDKFSSIEIELIHQLLKACGHQLRSDDQDALREMVASVQTKVASMQAETGISTAHEPDERVRFMLDLIYDLKKPTKQKKGQAAAAAGGLNAMSAALDISSLKKWLGRVKTRCNNANNALRISLHELLNADQDGRWWVVGGTWVGYQQPGNRPRGAQGDNGIAGASKADDDRLLKLAERQRMNTDVRKRIFVAIMGASDCLDAYERLLQLHLKEKQEREIVRVILHCCGQEKKFNRYYLVLSNKLCEMDPRYKFTFQLAFWDIFKQMATVAPRRLYNLAQLLAGIIIGGGLSLSCLKVLDFTSLDESTILFLRIVFEKILKIDEEIEMAQVFQRLLQTKKAQLTIDGLAVFFHQHLTSFKGEEDDATRQLLRKRSKSAKSLLDMLAKSAAANESMKDFM